MSNNQWVCEKATGKWMMGFRDPAIFLTDPVNYGLVDLGAGAPWPDPVFERWDAVLLRRPATAAEILDAQNEAAAKTAVLTSRQKDILAMCAVVVRAKGLAAWNAMTLQQKKDATFAEADVWRDMRVWAETNL
jgi:hypothetical protein